MLAVGSVVGMQIRREPFHPAGHDGIVLYIQYYRSAVYFTSTFSRLFFLLLSFSKEKLILIKRELVSKYIRSMSIKDEGLFSFIFR